MELYRDLVIEEYDKLYAVNIRNRFKSDARHIIQNSLEQARQSADETEWYGKIKETALNWL